MKLKNVLIIALALLVLLPTAFSLGLLATPGLAVGDLDKLHFQRLSIAASVVSALATFLAVGAALYIAQQQALEMEKREQLNQRQNAVQNLHYAMAISNDLRGRLTSLRNKLCNVGTYPLSTLTVTMDGFQKRYEALYDRELYRYFSGPIIDKITDMSGSFAGLEIVVKAIESRHDFKPHAKIVVGSAQPTQTFDSLFNEIDALFTSFENERKRLDGI